MLSSAVIAEVTAGLRTAGCVFAEEEALLLIESAASSAELAAMVERRVAGVPLEQVVGWAAFAGLRVHVQRGVFVPRRRSELVVTQVVRLLGAGAPQRPVLAVDLCCGSGALGLAVLHALEPRAVELYAVDLDPVAVRCATVNLAPVGGVALQGDLVAALPPGLRGRVDIVVASPPYVPTGQIELLPLEARSHESRLALDGGADGLDVVHRVLAQAGPWLAPAGWLVVEIAAGQADAAVAAARELGLPAYIVSPDDADATVLVAGAPDPADPADPADPRAPTGDDGPVHRLRAGDERAFADLVADWSPAMLRLARAHVSTAASSEEIVQEAWLAVLRGLDGFEGRSTLRTWVFSIVVNLAKTRGVREARVVPVSGLAVGDDPTSAAPTVDPRRFAGAGDQFAGHWSSTGQPGRWLPGPEQAAVDSETRRLVAEALVDLPEQQSRVVSLRDVHGLSSQEVCDLLGLTPANQRVLLHRGRARLREALADYYRGSEESA